MTPSPAALECESVEAARCFSNSRYDNWDTSFTVFTCYGSLLTNIFQNTDWFIMDTADSIHISSPLCTGLNGGWDTHKDTKGESKVLLWGSVHVSVCVCVLAGLLRVRVHSFVPSCLRVGVNYGLHSPFKPPGKAHTQLHYSLSPSYPSSLRPSVSPLFSPRVN